MELQGKKHQPSSMTKPFEIKKAPEKSSGAFLMAFLERFHVEKALPTAGSRRSLEGIRTMDLRCSMPERECLKL